MAQIDEKFNSLNDLYERLYPALSTKKSELKRQKIKNILERDLWFYCVNKIWKEKSDLRIHEMVSDILGIDELEIIKYKNENR